MQVEDKLVPKVHTLSGFDNSSVVTKGELKLTTFAEGVVKDTKFQVVEMEMAYNMILGRPWIHEMDIVPSTLHQVIKFPSLWGIPLKKQDQFEWTEECQQALKNLKTYLSNPPLLAKPKVGERLLIYLAVSEVAVSAVLVREYQGKQSPIYYVSKSLLDAETQYPQLEKLALALIMESRKLRLYFQCHPISIVTAYPLRNILHKHELSGRLAKWAIELSEYDITHQPITTIKSEVLADFLADFSQVMQLEADKKLQVFNGSNPGIWTLFTDGSSNMKGAGLGIVLVPPMGETIRQAIKCHSITNNEAEYKVVIIGLELARELGINKIVIKSDSQLVVNQMLGTYIAREA
ncbi:uncharacterized protein LOC142161988 [Nicotiana tabacum]|uniref:Uncharacterized protein LOC142161988 n=1 Tax=Nicotiana tabacum TaxID=4097 RepID=A0AC58RNS3_TOBAC